MSIRFSDILKKLERQCEKKSLLEKIGQVETPPTEPTTISEEFPYSDKPPPSETSAMIVEEPLAVETPSAEPRMESAEPSVPIIVPSAEPSTIDEYSLESVLPPVGEEPESTLSVDEQLPAEALASEHLAASYRPSLQEATTTVPGSSGTTEEHTPEAYPIQAVEKEVEPQPVISSHAPPIIEKETPEPTPFTTSPHTSDEERLLLEIESLLRKVKESQPFKDEPMTPAHATMKGVTAHEANALRSMVTSEPVVKEGTPVKKVQPAVATSPLSTVKREIYPPEKLPGDASEILIEEEEIPSIPELEKKKWAGINKIIATPLSLLARGFSSAKRWSIRVIRTISEIIRRAIHKAVEKLRQADARPDPHRTVKRIMVLISILIMLAWLFTFIV